MPKEILEIEIYPHTASDQDTVSQDMVEKCLQIAVKAHAGQRDRDNNTVILHPIIVGSMGKTAAEKCVGFLHDVVEDTDWTFDNLLKEGVQPDIVDTLRLLTHEEGITYEEYIQRIIDSSNKTAINVKLNDLHHNLTRGKAFGYHKLVNKHSRALRMIEESKMKLSF